MDAMLFRILLVEDNPGDAHFLRESIAFVPQPPQITHVDELQAAVDLLRREVFDAVLLDLNLPDSLGLVTLERALTAAGQLPVIVLTGLEDEALGSEAVRKGAQDYLVKGQIGAHRLLQTIHHAVERKRAEQSLLRAKQEWERTFDCVPDLITILDNHHRIVRVNRAMAERLGRSPAQCVGLACYECVHGRATPPEDCPHTRTLLCGQSQAAEVHDDRLGGDFLVTTTPLLDARGAIAGTVHVAHDITPHKRAEESLRAAKVSAEKAKTAAEHANRAKDHFLAVLSHELRTPLTPVVLGISMLQQRSDLDPATQQTLEMIRRNVEMEARLIDDLLDVARIARGKLELSRSPVELSTVIQRAVEVCLPDIEARRLGFGVSVGADAPYWLEADVPRLQQVFWNLLKNAIKFTPHGGSIGVRCRREAAEAVVEVHDSGIGIDAASLLRVFNAFEQADRAITQQFGGLGLGLAISKALVELHGGTISAHSAGRNQGATFCVRLPLTAAPQRPQAAAVSPLPAHAVRPLRILLVEDHGLTAELMGMLLTAEGHVIEAAGDVATGLELAKQRRFDLLISDLGLPDGSGHDLLRELRSQGLRLPAIAMSGYGQEDDIQRSYGAGFTAHLTKPASPEGLVEAIALAVRCESPTTNGE